MSAGETNSMRIVAAGAGRMGRGIAHVMAYAGLKVTLLDLKPRADEAFGELASSALADIRANLDTLRQLEKVTESQCEEILARIDVVRFEDASAALTDATFVFEGVPEVMSMKQMALELLSSLAPDDAIIASTTSTFSADELAKFVSLPSRFANAHWLNPAFLIPVVEVSPTQHTSVHALDALTELLRHAGKMPVRCKASPGFIVPRIQALAMNEAARLVEDGVATAEDVDTATRYGFGVRFAVLGLLEFIDYGGCDILHYASKYLTDALPSPRHEAPAIIGDMMANQETGLRDGKGFYDYAERDVPAYQRETVKRLVSLLDHLGLVPEPGGAVGPASNTAPPPASGVS